MNIALVEYGAGNLPSVERALTRLGVESRRASTLEGLASCDALILPGVGHFAADQAPDRVSELLLGLVAAYPS